MFYFARDESLRPYFSPQWRYSHLNGSGQTSEGRGNSNQVNGMVGAQYQLGGRFSAYGETGVAYAWSTTTTTPAQQTTIPVPSTYTQHGKAFGFAGRVGVILYF